MTSPALDRYRLIVAADLERRKEGDHRLADRIEHGAPLVEQVQRAAEPDLAVDLVDPVALIVIDPGIAAERYESLMECKETRHEGSMTGRCLADASSIREPPANRKE